MQTSSPAASKSPVACRPPVSAKVRCASSSRSGRDAARSGGEREPALDPRRRDGDGLDRALPADPAGGRGVEVPPQPLGVEAIRVDLDRVRGQVVGYPRRDRLETLRDAEPERELLVVAGRPHRDRDRLARDPELERLLDRDDVLLARAPGQAEGVDAARRVRGWTLAAHAQQGTCEEPPRRVRGTSLSSQSRRPRTPSATSWPPSQSPHAPRRGRRCRCPGTRSEAQAAGAPD